MPPHNEPLMGPLDVRYEPIHTYYVPETGMYTDGTGFYQNNAVTRATLNTDGLTWQTQRIDEHCVTRPELEFELNKLKNKIYQIMAEHVKLDITEEEFMNLLKE